MEYLLGFIFICIFCDLRTYKIPNALIVAGLAGSLLSLCITKGPPEMLLSLCKAILTMIILFFFFRIGAVGAGDVKLFGVIATLLPLSETLSVFILSLFLGAIHGCIVLIFQMCKQKNKKKPGKTRLHFTIAIALAYFLKMEGWY